MRWSQAFIPTLRDDPADAEAMSHKLLVRAGFVRQLTSGVYSLLPLGKRVADKVTAIIRDEIEAIGGVEFELPVVHPGEVWKRTGTAGQRPPLISSKTPAISPVAAMLRQQPSLFHPAIFYLVSFYLSYFLLESSQSVFCSIYCRLFLLHGLPISTFVP